jgi:uncharacterized protein YkvS
MNIELKQMRLVFTIGDTTWNRRVETLDGELIWQGVDEKIFEDSMVSDETLDEWESQMRGLAEWNIVEHKRIKS